MGRQGDIEVGIDPPDTGISRIAVEVAPVPAGWRFVAANRAGVVIHRWAQRSEWAELRREETVRWPRLALRIVGNVPGLHHWLLLESDRYPIVQPSKPNRSVTQLAPPPRPLTVSQLEAINIVFREHLEWPPVAGPEPVPLSAAGRRLGVGAGAVQQRLAAAQSRAYQLGSHQQYNVTEPEYLYVLVRNGYIPVPAIEGPR